jgi:hypothetical protein
VINAKMLSKEELREFKNRSLGEISQFLIKKLMAKNILLTDVNMGIVI